MLLGWFGLPESKPWTKCKIRLRICRTCPNNLTGKRTGRAEHWDISPHIDITLNLPIKAMPNWLTWILVTAAFIAGYWLAVWGIKREIEHLEPEISATAEAMGREAGEEFGARFDDVIDDLESALNLNNAFLRGYRCLVESVDYPPRWEKIRSALNRGSAHLQNVEIDDPSNYRFVAEALNSELNSLNCSRFGTQDGDGTSSPRRLITEETGE